MIKIAIILGTFFLCHAYVDVENEFIEVRTILMRQEREIKLLRNENRVLRADVKKMAVEIDNLKNRDTHMPKNSEEFTISQNDSIKEDNSSNKLITKITTEIVSPKTDMKHSRNPRLSPELVGFYAYMSNAEPSPSVHHTLIFDEVKTNAGGGYNQFSGMFTAPSSGLYVFTWTIYTGNHGQTGFYIYVNHEVLGATWGETDGVARDFDSDSGSIVVSLNANDNVYIRSARACSTYVVSDEGARTSFAGWRLN